MFLEWTRFSTSPLSRVTSYLSREVSTRIVPFALPPEGRYTTTLSPALMFDLELFLCVLETMLWLLELTLWSSVPLIPLVVRSSPSAWCEALPPLMPSADARPLSFRAREPLRSLLMESLDPLLPVLRRSRIFLASSSSSSDEGDSDSKLSLCDRRIYTGSKHETRNFGKMASYLICTFLHVDKAATSVQSKTYAAGICME